MNLAEAKVIRAYLNKHFKDQKIGKVKAIIENKYPRRCVTVKYNDHVLDWVFALDGVKPMVDRLNNIIQYQIMVEKVEK